tara:strand:+ start:112 stop:513 length:402 start_codon:yes stop_codon:yes gene_type:complete
LSPAVKGVKRMLTSPGLLSMHISQSFTLLLELAIMIISSHNTGGKASVAMLVSAALSAFNSICAYLGRGVPMLGVRLEAILGDSGVYAKGPVDKGLVQTWGGHSTLISALPSAARSLVSTATHLLLRPTCLFV